LPAVLSKPRLALLPCLSRLLARPVPQISALNTCVSSAEVCSRRGTDAAGHDHIDAITEGKHGNRKEFAMKHLALVVALLALGTATAVTSLAQAEPNPIPHTGTQSNDAAHGY
jgi:hypothetical protein